MDKRLVQLLQSGKIGGGNLYLLDTYNQAVHEDVSCTIRTNINTANLHFIFERMSEIKYVGQMSSSQNSRVIDTDGISYAVTNGEKDGEPKIIERDTPMKGNYTEPIIIDDYNQRVPQDQDVIGTVTTQFGNPAPRHGYKIAEPIPIPQATKQGYIEFKGHQLKEGDGFYLGDSEQFFRGGLDGMSRALKVAQTDVGVVQNCRIRKLTPRECFRLMGVSEVDIDKIQQSGVSQSQQYKMAGNSIVVDVLEHIFRKMFVDTGQESQQLSLF